RLHGGGARPSLGAQRAGTGFAELLVGRGRHRVRTLVRRAGTANVRQAARLRHRPGPPHNDLVARPPQPPPPPPPPPPAARLEARAGRVLGAIVGDSIGSAEPVGSQAIARRADVDCSSATVRAVMADLEALGLLEKPHTSAGRIPTSLGYRFYVDALVRMRPPAPAEKQLIEKRAQDAAAGQPLDEVLKGTTRLLHSLTRHAAALASPRPKRERVARLALVAWRAGRVLAVLVGRSGLVQNRLLVEPPGARPLGQAGLDRAAAFLNEQLFDLT